jgi:nucleotidyltransferase/DNA polymerase involved in DNA repair
LDLKGNFKRSAGEVAEVIRSPICQSLKISVSEGIGRNKLVSAVASKLKKPSCFIEIQDGREREFLLPLEKRQSTPLLPKKRVQPVKLEWWP